MQVKKVGRPRVSPYTTMTFNIPDDISERLKADKEKNSTLVSRLLREYFENKCKTT